jgi:dienelactone hydrolase
VSGATSGSAPGRGQGLRGQRGRAVTLASAAILGGLLCCSGVRRDDAVSCDPEALPILPANGAGNAEIRARIRRYLGERPAEAPPPNVRFEACVTLERTTRCRVSFDVEERERIPAWLFLPRARRGDRVPGIVAFHQTTALGKDEAAGLTDRAEMSYALELGEEGYAVIAFDDVAAGDRVEPGHAAYDTSAFYARHPEWSALDKAVWDGRRAVDALCSLPEVDCGRVAAVGHSQGGVYAWMLAADDDRVKAAVVNAGYITFAGDPDPERWARDEGWVGAPALRGSIAARRFPFDFDEWLALAAPRSVLLVGYADDEVFPDRCGLEGTRERLAGYLQSLGAAHSIVIRVVPGRHVFPDESHRAMIEFLAERL